MSGYGASARIDPRTARFAAGWDPPAGRVDEDDRAGPTVAWIEAPPGELGPGALSRRWTAIRERWSQLTFFLLDPNSWR